MPATLLPEKAGRRGQRAGRTSGRVPSPVLARRPDVLQAERQLRAANASIGAARAAFFPAHHAHRQRRHRELDARRPVRLGFAQLELQPQLSLPIFNAGALRASLDVAEVQRDINVATYEKTIQSAFREVADGLADRATLAEQLDAERRLVAASEETFRLSEARYRNGIDSYLGLLDAQRSLYSAQQELIGVRLSEASNRVTLYKVLGGGWK